MVLMALKFVQAFAQLVPLFRPPVTVLSTYQFAPWTAEAAQNNKMAARKNRRRAAVLDTGLCPANCVSGQIFNEPGYFIMGGIITSVLQSCYRASGVFAKRLGVQFVFKVNLSTIRTIPVLIINFDG
jgi:hypothetical protein